MKQTASIVINDPCIRCGKSIRADYEGFCMDCADEKGCSELNNRGEATEEELKIIEKYRSKKDVRTSRHNPRQ